MRSPLLVVLCVSCLTIPALAARTASFPDTTAGIHLEMVFNVEEFLSGEWGREKGFADVVWGSYSATEPPGMVNAFYIPIAVDDAFSEKTHTIAWYKRHHPDWLEYRCDGERLAFQFKDKKRAPLDFANPAVRKFQWAAIDRALDKGYQSVAVDELSLFNDFHRCGHYDSSGQWVRQYSGKAADAAYRRDVLDWQRLTYRHIHRKSPAATMQLNRPYDPRSSKADNHLVMTTTDLLFDEGGFTNYGLAGANYPTPEAWRTIVDYLGYVQAHGVCYMTNGEEPELSDDITKAERLWIVGNYLLVKETCTYMYIAGRTPDGGQDYGRIIDKPEYHIAIGSPADKMFKTQGVWERDFTGGLTLVNPYDTTAVVTLPGGQWTDTDLNPVGPTVTLTRQSAQILLKANET